MQGDEWGSRCRLCLGPDAPTDVIAPNLRAVRLRKILSDLFAIEIRPHDATTKVCLECVNTAERHHGFYVQVRNNQFTLGTLATLPTEVENKPTEEVVIKEEYSSEETSFIEPEVCLDSPSEADNKSDHQNEDASKPSKANYDSFDYLNLPNEGLIKNGRFIVKPNILENIANEFFHMQCTACKEPLKFNKLSDFMKHMSSSHKLRGMIECCGAKLKRRDQMYEHMAKHLQPSEFQCRTCKKEFLSLKTLKPHSETHLTNSKRTFKCDQCEKSYARIQALNRHKLSHNIIVDDAAPEYECTQCSKSFQTSHQYKAHLRIHHSNSKFLCPVCGKEFKTKLSLVTHLESHDPSGEKKITCEHCGVISKNRITHKVHLRMHSDVRFHCDKCIFTTHRKWYIKRHILMKHSDLKPHKCQWCGKEFKKTSSLKSHVSMHTGVRRFSCPHCPQTFAWSGNYYQHCKTIHRDKYVKRTPVKTPV